MVHVNIITVDSQKPLILAVDDEADMLATYTSILKKKYSLLTANSGQKALELITTKPLSLILLDIRMPGIDGLELLHRFKEIDADLEVIMVTASKEINTAVEAIKKGAFDFITKPFEVSELLVVIEKALAKRTLVRENLCLKENLREVEAYCDLIGQTPVMKKLFTTIDQIAPTDSTILIQGDSGTGKELVARAIHRQSQRKEKPFVAINCAAIPENLLESELFGHERGSFTGALERKLGKFELADGGTLFLDEIGCMPAAMQAKLLRVLEDRTIERLGSEKGLPINVRIISATNINFEREIKAGKFRHDLYYRLNVIPLNLAPLKERKEDILLLADYFLKKLNRQLNRQVRGFTKEAEKALFNYAWPGNVRELANLVERVVVLAQADEITPAELPFHDIDQTLLANSPTENRSFKELLSDFERQLLHKTMNDFEGNVTQAAKKLKMVRTSLIARLKTAGLSS